MDNATIQTILQAGILVTVVYIAKTSTGGNKKGKEIPGVTPGNNPDDPNNPDD